MNPGEPMTVPDWVSMLASVAREMPKSMTRGPSSASSTFDGFRSRCTTPAAWIACRPSASPAASVMTDPAGSGPRSSSASASDGPATFAVASHGTGPSTSASMTSAVNRPPTFRAAATSRPQRVRNPGSPASSGRMIFTATRRPPGDWPRNTWPIPPAPSRPSRRYGPAVGGSPACSSPTMPALPRQELGRDHDRVSPRRPVADGLGRRGPVAVQVRDAAGDPGQLRA